VWDVNTQPFPEAHFATFPASLIEPCVQISTSPGDFILDPFFSSGTVGLVAQDLDRNYIGIELNPEYINIAYRRLRLHSNAIYKIAS
jgi:site-specific DNA-methyltransferase (cytosine-N4-specific)